MNVVDIHAYKPRSKRPVLERIALWQLCCVFFIIAAVWLFEGIDLPARLRGVPTASADWRSATWHSIVALVFGLAAVLPIYLYQRRFTRKAVTICSYCRRVQVDEEEWTAIEAYFAEKTHVTYSHGVCPDCRDRVMKAYRTEHGIEGEIRPGFSSVSATP